MKKTILLFTLVAVVSASFAQKKKTTTSAIINFDAATSIDALPKAENKTVVASLNTKTGDVAFESIMKSFSFSNPMMQEHFNGAKWLESDKFPKSSFKGKITNLTEVNFSKDGTYSATITGNLSIHGVTKPVTTTASITVNGKSVKTTTDFTIKLADYGVNVSGAGGKIAEEPKISVTADFK
jgi:polyisoprenoid-binding protein YceI